VGDALTAPQPLEKRPFLVTLLERDDHVDRTPDGFLGAVAEDELGAGIPRRDPAVERLAHDRVRRRLDDRGQQRTGLLGTLAVRDVEREAPAMDEHAVLPETGRVDQHVLDRAVPTTHPGRVFAQTVTGEQPRANIVDHVPIDVKVGDRATDVLVVVVAEQRELGPVGPEHRAVRTDPM
jgi:hypothetical protein